VGGAIALAALLVLVYLPTLRGPLSPSDRESTLDIALVSTYRNVPFFFTRDFLMFSQGQFRPLSYALLAVVRTFVPADRPLFWHLWLLGFHWFAALLVFVVAYRWLRRWLPAALAALLYALDPLGSVVVTDINQFHLLLGLVFYLGALACYLRPPTSEKGGRASFPGHGGREVGTSSGEPAGRRAVPFSQAGPGRAACVATWVLFVAGIFTSKIVFTLPVVLFVYELLSRRSGFRRSLWRLVPYAAVTTLVAPLWWAWRAHPLHYRYHPYPEGAGWTSLYHTFSALGLYAGGLFGVNLPAGLTELAQTPTGWSDWRVLLGAGGWVLVAAGGLWALRRRRLLGVGLMLCALGLVPFASVAWHQVPEPLTWSSLWVVVAGLALSVAGVLGAAADRWGRGSAVRRMAAGVVVAAIVGLGAETRGLVRDWADPLRYWERALRVNAQSTRASVALGKVYLARGDPERALRYLFCPSVSNLSESCAAMTLYYARHGQPLASLVHLKVVTATVSGIVHGRSAVTAEVMERLGALDYAEASWGKLLVGNPYNTKGMKQVARVLNIKGFSRAARRLLEHALAIDPHDPEAYDLLEQVREREQSLEPPALPEPPPPDWLMFALSGQTSTRLRRQTVELSRQMLTDPMVQADAATILLNEGHPQEVLVAIDRAIERLPRVAIFWAIRASALDLTDDHRGAALAAEEALDLAPQATDLPILYNLLGVLLLNRANNPAVNDPGVLDRAISLFEASLKAGRELSMAHANLGTALAQKGDVGRALDHLRRALTMAPDQTRNYLLLARVVAGTGNYKEACSLYRRALAIDPTSIRAHAGLANLLSRSGDLEEARQHYLHIVSLRPDNLDALNALGLVCVRQGRLDEATGYFRQALERNPSSDEYCFNLVLALEQQGRNAAAVEELRKHLARTDSPSAQAALAWLLATSPDDSVRRGEEAVALAEALCQRTRYQDPGALQVLAAAYAETGRFGEAQRLARGALDMARAAKQSELARGLAEQLRLYQAGRPFRALTAPSKDPLAKPPPLPSG